MRDAYAKQIIDNNEYSILGVKGIVNITRSNTDLVNRIEISKRNVIRVVKFQTFLPKNDFFTTFDDFDGCSWDLFVTEPLIEKIHQIALIANNYAVINIDESQIATCDDIGLHDCIDVDWKDELKDFEQTVNWKSIILRNDRTDNAELMPPLRHNSREIHFSEFIPEYVDIPRPIGGALLSSASLIME